MKKVVLFAAVALLFNPAFSTRAQSSQPAEKNEKTKEKSGKKKQGEGSDVPEPIRPSPSRDRQYRRPPSENRQPMQERQSDGSDVPQPKTPPPPPTRN
jgi:hypothetical protein